jgi:hypothetical protein
VFVKNSLIVDADVEAVAGFMQRRIAASRLVAVADGLAAIAPLLWGRFQPEAIQALRLEVEPIPVERIPATST